MKIDYREIFNTVSVVKHYYPIASISTPQHELMEELSNLYDEDRLKDVFKGRESVLDAVDLGSVFKDWMEFNDWIQLEELHGYFAEINTPVNQHSTHSFGYCHIDFIYYETLGGLIEECKRVAKHWYNYDLEQSKTKKG